MHVYVVVKNKNGFFAMCMVLLEKNVFVWFLLAEILGN